MIVIHLFYFASRVALIGTPDSHVTATPFSGDAGINGTNMVLITRADCSCMSFGIS